MTKTIELDKELIISVHRNTDEDLELLQIGGEYLIDESQNAYEKYKINRILKIEDTAFNDLLEQVEENIALVGEPINYIDDILRHADLVVNKQTALLVQGLQVIGIFDNPYEVYLAIS